MMANAVEKRKVHEAKDEDEVKSLKAVSKYESHIKLKASPINIPFTVSYDRFAGARMLHTTAPSTCASTAVEATHE